MIGVLILLISFMLRAAWTGGLSPFLEQVVGTVVTPLQKGAASISGFVQGYFQRYVHADDLARENEELREQLNELRSQLIDFEDYKRENETLRQFLDIKDDNPDFELEPAAVVARDPNDRFYSFTIDKGYLDGISLLDPVISADGLVGRVQEVGANYSKVVTILDVMLDVGGRVVRTGENIVVNGDVRIAQEGYCKLTFLPRESSAAVGDLVVTTGGGLFPKDIVIGEIVRIGDNAGGLSLYGVVDPAADIEGLKNVMVIKSFEGQEERDEQ